MAEDEPTPIARRGGRPRVPDADRLVRMYVRLTPGEYDRICRKALALDITIAALVRQELRRVGS